MTRRGLVAALVLAACGAPDPVYRWPEGRVATVEVRLREELLPTRAARELKVTASGRTRGGSSLDLEIVSVRHERLAGGEVSAVDTETTGVAPGERTSEDAALARIAEGLRGRPLRLTFDPVRGLVRVEGLAAALAEAGDGPGVEEQRAGLRLLADDESVARGLRAAGLDAIPARLDAERSAFSRTVDVAVPGVGVVPCTVTGIAGPAPDGSRVARASGGPQRGAEASGSAGPAPPPEIGPVVLAAVDVETETLHDAETFAPLRGRAVVRLPYAGGATVVTTTSFLLSVPR